MGCSSSKPEIFTTDDTNSSKKSAQCARAAGENNNSSKSIPKGSGKMELKSILRKF